MNRRITSGRIFAPTLWKIPTWSEPASPAESAARSAWAAWRRATIDVRVPEQQPAGLGQRDRPRAAGPLDQLLADDPLERRDLLADRRLRVAELDRGAAERALGLDGVERGQMAQLDSEPVVELRSGACGELEYRVR